MSESENAAHQASVHERSAHVRGLVLAAGAGRRMGGPKALIRRHPNDPTLVESAVRLLHDGGCAGITVVVGAAGPEVTAIVTALGRDIDVVTCHDWYEGMGASLRSGLTALARASHEGEARVDAVLVTLVDLPDLTPEVVARVLDAPGHVDNAHSPHPHPDEHAVDVHQSSAPAIPELRATLRRAAYDGVPGLPALIGRDHWEGVVATAVGDHGARNYYRAHPHELVECGDLATGRDADTPGDLDTSR